MVTLPSVQPVGYAYLHTKHGSPTLAPTKTAIREKWRGAGRTAVPGSSVVIVPFESINETATSVDHILLALKYEGVDLPLLEHVLKSVEAAEIAAAFATTPTGEYVRRMGYLWEHFNGRLIENISIPSRRPVKLFSPDRYYVRHKGVVDQRWGVEFNGLGSPAYCPVVQRSPVLEQADAQLWTDYQAFMKLGAGQDLKSNSGRLFKPKLDDSLLARIIRHAYLDETESSFRIESEEPSGNKKEQFVQMLRNAHDGQVVNEDFLTELQRFCVDGRWHEFEYRNRQNWLGNGSRILSSRVTYVPPPAHIVQGMMEVLCDLVNNPHHNDLPAMALAGVVSFGFVYIHPFMDGNGRISRFLAHQSLCNSGKLPHGMVLPLSAAMLDEQEYYSAALIHYSLPMRKLWEVSVSSDPDVPHLEFLGSESSYRYWDADVSAAFALDMGRIALDQKLVHESMFLEAYDKCLVRIANLAPGLSDKDTSAFIRFAATNKSEPGALSINKRKKFPWLNDTQIEVFETLIKEEFAEYFAAVKPESEIDAPVEMRQQ